jgi:hypothetical protein
MNWGSSVSVVPVYRLDDRGSIPGRERIFPVASVSRPAHPVGTGGPFPGVKRGRGVTLTTHLQ